MGILEGKTALVTGGSRGIGRVIAQRLAESGALVGFNYATNTQGAEETVRSIEAAGGEAFAIQAELGAEGSIERLLEAFDSELDAPRGDTGLDILINNVGGGQASRIEATSAEQLDQTFSLNFRMPFLLTQALTPRIRDDGRIVNISSVTVRIAFEEGAAYACCKAALDLFSRLLAKEVGARGICVNSVAVGRTAGESNAAFFSTPEGVSSIVDVTALRRVGTEQDIAGVVHALVSPDGRWITGQVVDATGGYML